MTNNFKAHLGGSEKLRGEEEEERQLELTELNLNIFYLPFFLIGFCFLEM